MVDLHSRGHHDLRQHEGDRVTPEEVLADRHLREVVVEGVVDGKHTVRRKSRPKRSTRNKKKQKKKKKKKAIDNNTNEENTLIITRTIVMMP